MLKLLIRISFEMSIINYPIIDIVILMDISYSSLAYNNLLLRSQFFLNQFLHLFCYLRFDIRITSTRWKSKAFISIMISYSWSKDDYLSWFLYRRTLLQEASKHCLKYISIMQRIQSVFLIRHIILNTIFLFIKSSYQLMRSHIKIYTSFGVIFRMSTIILIVACTIAEIQRSSP